MSRVTDEMVERAAEAVAKAHYNDPLESWQEWDREWLHGVVRTAVEAALAGRTAKTPRAERGRRFARPR